MKELEIIIKQDFGMWRMSINRLSANGRRCYSFRHVID